MTLGKGFSFVHYGIAVTVILSAMLGYNLFVGDRHLFLPGETTHGHHQIELQCTACHVESYKSGEPMQQACMSCHGEALEKARDTHPKKKFTDPRNADLLANLDATQCVTCHIEHSPEITGEFGVTMPEDFCFYCHQKIADDRPSHADYAFDSCSDAGCHNYHDNKALYEKFLAKHLDEPDILNTARVRIPNALSLWLKNNQQKLPLQSSDHDGGAIEGTTPTIVAQWSDSVHAQVRVNCTDCHDPATWSREAEGATESLVRDAGIHLDDALAITSCESCHERQTSAFVQGLHGMRLAAKLPPMTVGDARLPMHNNARHETLTCVSCHDPHQPDLAAAAVDACLGCHNDQHSQNYLASSHAQLWKREVNQDAEPGSGVSCASCHMPRIKKGKRVTVEHNQSLTLEPNSKMIRPVCLNCHGLEFSVAALTDDAVISSNFASASHQTHESFALVRTRLDDKKRKKQAQKSQD